MSFLSTLCPYCPRDHAPRPRGPRVTTRSGTATRDRVTAAGEPGSPAIPDRFGQVSAGSGNVDISCQDCRLARADSDISDNLDIPGIPGKSDRKSKIRLFGSSGRLITKSFPNKSGSADLVGHPDTERGIMKKKLQVLSTLKAGDRWHRTGAVEGDLTIARVVKAPHAMRAMPGCEDLLEVQAVGVKTGRPVDLLAFDGDVFATRYIFQNRGMNGCEMVAITR